MTWTRLNSPAVSTAAFSGSFQHSSCCPELFLSWSHPSSTANPTGPPCHKPPATKLWLLKESCLSSAAFQPPYPTERQPNVYPYDWQVFSMSRELKWSLGMSLSCAAASVSLALRSPCSTARLPGRERSLYSVEEFQGCESSALIETSALAWGGSHLCPPELVSAGWALAQAGMCRSCRANPDVRTKPRCAAASPLLLPFPNPSPLWDVSVGTKSKGQV